MQTRSVLKALLAGAALVGVGVAQTVIPVTADISTICRLRRPKAASSSRRLHARPTRFIPTSRATTPARGPRRPPSRTPARRRPAGSGAWAGSR